MTANKPLDVLLERAVVAIAMELCPDGWIVLDVDAPDTLEKATRAFQECGRPVVDGNNSGATIWSEAAVNYAFRAWHDYRHITLQAEFDYAGESAVHSAMLEDLERYFARQVCSPPFPSDRKRARMTLQAENIGQLDYWKAVGHPPVDQRTFAEGYLASAGML